MSAKAPNSEASAHETREESRDSEDTRPESARSREQSQDVESSDDIRAPGVIDPAPPLLNEAIPPLPNEAPPGQPEDDGWDPVWDNAAQSYYFHNRFTGVTQWENPRVPETSQPAAPGVSNHDRNGGPAPPRVAGGYDPAIHGDYDPNADYAQPIEPSVSDAPLASDPAISDPNTVYAATGHFNRFTGKWQAAGLTPENFNDDNKSRRQMSAFFDVDAAANSHDGKSLKAERSGKKLTKQELKAFKEKRREKKEEKRRAWLRD